QINTISTVCFLILPMLGKIFRWLPASTRQMITQALVISWFDYSNSMYVGITDHLQQRMQIKQNSATKLVHHLPKQSYITPHLRKLHCLPV
ncbi:hypothetical protein NDU88_011796, partial [Pleurodeles waltl]